MEAFVVTPGVVTGVAVASVCVVAAVVFVQARKRPQPMVAEPVVEEAEDVPVVPEVPVVTPSRVSPVTLPAVTVPATTLPAVKSPVLPFPNDVAEAEKAEEATSPTTAVSDSRTAVYAVQGKRNLMADEHLITTTGSTTFCAVFDGCGGDKASASAKKSVEAALKARPATDLADLLRNAEVETLAEAKAGRWPDATTAVVARLDRETRTLDVSWIGDSRCVVGRATTGKKAVVADVLTSDHNASSKSEAKRIRQAGGRIGRSESEANASGSKKLLGKVVGSGTAFGAHRNNPKRVYPGGITLTRAIGGLPLKRQKPQLVIADPEVAPTRSLDANDKFLILASDGLFEGKLTPQDAVDIVHTTLTTPREPADGTAPPPLEDAASKLAWASQAQGSSDNTTVCVVLLNGD